MSSLTVIFSYHISKICSSSFYHIRQLRQIRSSLDSNSAILLANAIVTSKLDYCKSFYYNLPVSSIQRLQRVQKALATAVTPSVKLKDYFSPMFKNLHWLPVQQRISFKIACLTFKTLHQNQPVYLFELLTPYNPSRTLRSTNQQFLAVPKIDSAAGRRSFFFTVLTI